MSSISEKTERITAKEFLQRVEENPAWAKGLEHPVIVNEHVNLSDSKITHLSRWLRFSGKDDHGESANFCRCEQLVNAEGTYDGSVDFSLSGIKQIGRLKVLGVDRSSISAYFYKCKDLKTLSGSYYGPVVACESALEKIENFKVSKSNRKGEKLDLSCTTVNEIDQLSASSLKISEITWDEHIDDKYKESITNYIKKYSKQNENIEDRRDQNIVDGAKGTILRTIAQAIGADDILAQKNLPITNPKRRWFLQKSTIITALIALFLYKTSEELTKQVLIDPTVNAIKRTPELIINWSDPKEKTQNKTVWSHEFSPTLERFIKSNKTQEDKIILARDTMLLMGLKPELLMANNPLERGPIRQIEINNAATPVNISNGKLDVTPVKTQAQSQKKTAIAREALQALESFEELMPDIADTHIQVSVPNFSEPTPVLENKQNVSKSKSKKMQVPLLVGF
jgi:hypothetical protein